MANLPPSPDSDFDICLSDTSCPLETPARSSQPDKKQQQPREYPETETGGIPPHAADHPPGATGQRSSKDSHKTTVAYKSQAPPPPWPQGKRSGSKDNGDDETMNLFLDPSPLQDLEEEEEEDASTPVPSAKASKRPRHHEAMHSGRLSTSPAGLGGLGIQPVSKKAKTASGERDPRGIGGSPSLQANKTPVQRLGSLPSYERSRMYSVPLDGPVAHHRSGAGFVRSAPPAQTRISPPSMQRFGSRDITDEGITRLTPGRDPFQAGGTSNLGLRPRLRRSEIIKYGQDHALPRPDVPTPAWVRRAASCSEDVAPALVAAAQSAFRPGDTRGRLSSAASDLPPPKHKPSFLPGWIALQAAAKSPDLFQYCESASDALSMGTNIRTAERPRILSGPAWAAANGFNMAEFAARIWLAATYGPSTLPAGEATVRERTMLYFTKNAKKRNRAIKIAKHLTTTIPSHLKQEVHDSAMANALPQPRHASAGPSRNQGSGLLRNPTPSGIGHRGTFYNVPDGHQQIHQGSSSRIPKAWPKDATAAPAANQPALSLSKVAKTSLFTGACWDMAAWRRLAALQEKMKT